MDNTSVSTSTDNILVVELIGVPAVSGARGHVIAEYSNGSLSKERIFLGERPLAAYVNGTLYYRHFDNLAARMTTDASGNDAGQQGTFPFGEDWYTANTISTRHFTTYERDSESSNDYALHRFYVNRLARFSSTDPVRGSAANPQSWNRYSYVTNDPIDRVDPQGLECLGFCTQIFGCFIDSCCAFGQCPVDPGGDALADDLLQLVLNYAAAIADRAACSKQASDFFVKCILPAGGAAAVGLGACAFACLFSGPAIVPCLITCVEAADLVVSTATYICGAIAVGIYIACRLSTNFAPSSSPGPAQAARPYGAPMCLTPARPLQALP